MMTIPFKWMALGAALGFSVAMGVSCGPAKCTSANCAFGCCDSAGVCATGSSDSQCGSSGNVCTSCVLGQSCQLGVCTLTGTGGNGGGNSGGCSGGGAGGGTGGGGTGGGATGGGGGTSDALCMRLGNANLSFFAGRTVCTDGSSTVNINSNVTAQCNNALTACANDRTTMATYAGCIEGAPTCTPGNEGAAISGLISCSNAFSSAVSPACLAALGSSTGGGAGGGGGTPTGGGTGGGTPVGGGTGGGTPVGGGTGGGTPVGGGGGTANTCGNYATRYTALMAGRSTCPGPNITLNASTNLASACSSSCNSTDQTAIATFTNCLGSVPNCTSGNEASTTGGFFSCGNNALSTISTPCQSALTTFGSSGTGGGGGGTPIGGGTGGGTTTTGCASTSCTTISWATAASDGSFSNGTSFEFTSGISLSSATDPFNLISGEVTWRIGTTATNVTVPGTRNLATEGTYTQCKYCSTMQESCTTAGGCTGRQFLARTGTLSVSAASRATTGSFAGTLSNVCFEEWDLGADTAVPGGACIRVPSVTINATF